MSRTRKVKTHRDRRNETGEEQSQEHAHTFFAAKGNCSKKELVLAGQTVNSAYCGDILRRLHENVRRLRAKLLQRQKNFLLYHDNAPSHTYFFIRECFTMNNITIAPPLNLMFSVSSIEDETERPPF
jgi:uncharacterized protein YecT (DUF1311 family)